MRKILSSLMLFVAVMFVAGQAFATTCSNGSCDDPNPCGTPECTGSYGGSMTVEAYGYAESWGDDANAFSGAVYDLNKHVNKDGVKGDVNLFGGFAANTEDHYGHAEAGGYSHGTVKWNIQDWKSQMAQ